MKKLFITSVLIFTVFTAGCSVTPINNFSPEGNEFIEKIDQTYYVGQGEWEDFDYHAVHDTLQSYPNDADKSPLLQFIDSPEENKGIYKANREDDRFVGIVIDGENLLRTAEAGSYDAVNFDNAEVFGRRAEKK